MGVVSKSGIEDRQIGGSFQVLDESIENR